MKEIIIISKKHGAKTVCIDEEDYTKINKHTWYIKKAGNTFYAGTNLSMGNDKYRTMQMHRFILNLTNVKIHCDHKDRNGLNNQKNNLRVCNQSQNSINKKSLGGASKYRGVTISKYTKKSGAKYIYWSVRIVINGKRKDIKKYPFTPKGEVQAAERLI